MRVWAALRRLVRASTSPVAAGGDTGWWQWLLPGLVVLVVAFAALNVRWADQHSKHAGDAANQAARFVSAVEEARTTARDGDPVRRARLLASLRAVGRATGEDDRVATW